MKKLSLYLLGSACFIAVVGIFAYRTVLPGDTSPLPAAVATLSPDTTIGSCALNIALVLDASGSIGPRGMAEMKASFTSFVRDFPTSTTTTFSVTSFSNTARRLQEATRDRAKLTASFATLQPRGFTNWEQGLSVGASTTPAQPGMRTVLIVASDGQPNRYGPTARGVGEDTDPAALAAATERADLLKKAGVRIISIGIGKNVQKAAMEGIASPGEYYHATDFGPSLATALAQAAAHLCATSTASVATSSLGTPSPTPGMPVVRGSGTIKSPTTYTLTYTAGSNGTISGATPQTVTSGSSGTAVTAVPNSGYAFSAWSDSVGTASRTDTNVTSDKTVTASFVAADPDIVVSSSTDYPTFSSYTTLSSGNSLSAGSCSNFSTTSIKILNQGTGALTTSSSPTVTLTFGGAQSFEVETMPSFPIPASGTRTFIIRKKNGSCSPSTSGTVTLSTNDPDTPEFSITIQVSC